MIWAERRSVRAARRRRRQPSARCPLARCPPARRAWPIQPAV